MNWWKDFYDENLARVLLHQASREHETIAFLEKVLSLEAGALLFDQCCGEGRLSIPFANAGYKVIGIDQCESYIKTAKNHRLKNTQFHTADAFTYDTETNVDGAFNWWTSFGYSKDREQNKKMIIKSFSALKKGAKFALDFINVPNLLSDFRPDLLTRAQSEAGEILLIRESSIDYMTGGLLKTWTYILPEGKPVIHHTRVQLYLPNELVNMFQEVGFVEIELYGDIDYSKLGPHSPRCIIVGRKA